MTRRLATSVDVRSHSRPWALRASRADLAFHGVAFAQLVHPLTRDRALVEEELLARAVADKSEAFLWPAAAASARGLSWKLV
jgi:hypothetical protein